MRVDGGVLQARLIVPDPSHPTSLHLTPPPLRPQNGQSCRGARLSGVQGSGCAGRLPHSVRQAAHPQTHVPPKQGGRCARPGAVATRTRGVWAARPCPTAPWETGRPDAPASSHGCPEEAPTATLTHCCGERGCTTPPLPRSKLGLDAGDGAATGSATPRPCDLAADPLSTCAVCVLAHVEVARHCLQSRWADTHPLTPLPAFHSSAPRQPHAVPCPTAP
jgi:hypothetical protein